MTQGQIVTFTIIARYYYALYSAKVVGYSLIGDPSFEYHRTRLIIADGIIDQLKCYDPDSETNCLTWDEMYSLMQNLMQILGMCGDPYTLSESDTTCCDPLEGVTILNP